MTGDNTSVRIENAKQVYRDTPSGMHMRNSGFFNLGLKLKTLGLDDAEIKHQLLDADYDGSRAKKGVIDGVLKSLRDKKYG